jgi:DNA-3-methyladenine glycosylase II
VIAFHGRDPEGLAERAEGGAAAGGRLRKGLCVGGVPMLLDLKLSPDEVRGRAEAGGVFADDLRRAARAMAERMLGLHTDARSFEASVRRDELLGPIVRRQRGLRIPLTATPFEALSWAVVGQQINLAFAIQLRRALIRAAGRPHSSGLWCYPDAADIARLAPDQLRALKFSGAKAETLVRVARLTATGELPLERWAAGGVDHAEMEAALLAIKGIGPWTVNYVLLRGFGLADCSLHGDAAVRSAIQRALGAAERIAEGRARTILERYRPHRSLAAAHLWASLNTVAPSP